MMRRHIVTLAVAAVLTFAGSTWAFHRNLTGSWSTPDGRHVVIAHDDKSDHLDLVIVGSLAKRINRLEFSGDLSPLGEVGAGPNDFGLNLVLAPVTITTGDPESAGTCDITGDLVAMGTVLNQAPGRVLRMMPCQITLTLSCDDGKKHGSKKMTIGCAGDWN